MTASTSVPLATIREQSRRHIGLEGGTPCALQGRERVQGDIGLYIDEVDPDD